MRHRPAAALPGLFLTGLLLTGGCGGDPASGGEAASCPPPTPAGNASALPRALDVDALGTVTKVVRKGGYVNATATAEGEVREVQERFARAVERAGYSVVGSENEVVEADVFFARGERTTGAAKFVQTRCAGRVRVHLFVGESQA